MSRDWTLYLEDTLESATKIGRYIQGMNLDSFSSNDLVVGAVIPRFCAEAAGCGQEAVALLCASGPIPSQVDSMRRMKIPTLVLVCALATMIPATGCERNESPVAETENREPLWLSGGSWTVSAEPELLIGVTEGEPQYMLVGVSDARTLGDGRIAVALSRTLEVRLFDPVGRYEQSLGRSGVGPGEFSSPAWLRVFPESGSGILIENEMAGRVHRFAPDGTLIETLRMPESALPKPVRFVGPWIVGRLSDERFLIGTPAATDDGSDPEIRRSATVYWDAARGQPMTDSITSFKNADVYHLVRRGWNRYAFEPFALDVHAAVSGDSSFVVIGTEPTIEEFSTSGRLLRRVSWNAEREPITSDVLKRFIDVQLGGPDRTETNPVLEEFYRRDFDLPEFIPIAKGLHIDPEGAIWVERYTLPWDHSTRFDVINTSGRWLGTVRMPSQVRVFEIGRNYILGGAQDEVGSEAIVRYHLARTP